MKMDKGHRLISKKWTGRLLLGLMIAALMAASASCAGSQPTASGNLNGKVVIDGSGTVYPLMAAIAEKYMIESQPDVSVQVGRAGSSAGFVKFIAGETDLSDASRKISADEIAQLEAKGLAFGTDVLEIKLALDGLTLVINKQNTWAAQMTREEIVNAFTSGHYRADDKVLWSDIRTGWPAQEISFYGPNENHGTFEYFYQVILNKKDLVKTISLQQEYATLVDLVSKDVNAIAFFGFGYYNSNKDQLTAVKVDFGSGPVEPSLATIGESLPYAGFTRPVYTYLNVQYAKVKPQVLDYARYIVSQGAPKLAGDAGFAPLPDAQYAASLAQLDAIG
jgi:phosphate transport system substrate-binding protein